MFLQITISQWKNYKMSGTKKVTNLNLVKDKGKNEQSKVSALSPREIVSELDRYVIGQKEAKKAVAVALRNRWRRQALTDEMKDEVLPKNILMIGPTGVGKTELAKQLSKTLGVELIRFDMSEFSEKHTISKLIGSPPGYVGFDQGGQLSESIEKNPYCVLLIDEIEKAHPDIFNILLQIMDYGKLKDQNGKNIDFRNVILILTSNIGASELEKDQIGFSNKKNDKIDQETINKVFSPEFRNRLDSIISFNRLDKKIIKQIVSKFILELETQLNARDVVIELSNAASDLICEKGYSKTMGARPISRYIDEHIKKTLADEIIHGKLIDGGHVKVDSKDDKIIFIYKKIIKSAKPEKVLGKH